MGFLKKNDNDYHPQPASTRVVHPTIALIDNPAVAVFMIHGLKI